MKMQVPFATFLPMHNEIRDKLNNVYNKVVDKSYFIQGEECKRFEEEFAEYCGVKYCVGVATGLDALMLILKAMNIGAGDEVIVPSNTYIATALAVSYNGAKPVFVEPVLETYNLDVNKIEEKQLPELNDEFAGMLAERYYKGVKEALMKIDDKMLYLGSRLHGTPKYMENVVRAAGEWCDVISINYYSRWDVELTGAVKDWETWAPDAPFIVTEFYTKAMDTDLNNKSGAGFAVPTQKERAYAYQHFTLGLLEAKNCVGWHWFKYQDDDGEDNSGEPANKGLFDNNYDIYPWLAKYARDLNYNAYRLMDYFDK